MFSEGPREGMKDLDCWVEPTGPLFISTLRPVELLDLRLKHVENVARRSAALELGSEWVCENILPYACLVRSQGIIKNKLEVGRGSRVSVRHKGGNGEVEGR
jgi:hypothetical protein